MLERTQFRTFFFKEEQQNCSVLALQQNVLHLRDNFAQNAFYTFFMKKILFFVL